MQIVIEKLAESLRVGGLFFYKALWSILFGVAVTAAIDVFVDKERMAHLLGGRDVKTVSLATGLGAASSSCTFGSVAIGQSLFKKGASAESTFAFSLASTNIVFEQHPRIRTMASAGIRLDYTFFLTAAFIALTAALWVVKHRGLPEKVERSRVKDNVMKAI